MEYKLKKGMCLSGCLQKEEMQTRTHTDAHTHLGDLAIDKDKGHSLTD